jgi:hypothetical protein
MKKIKKEIITLKKDFEELSDFLKDKEDEVMVITSKEIKENLLDKVITKIKKIEKSLDKKIKKRKKGDGKKC